MKAIVYDAVGTLLHVTPSVAAIYADVGRRFGSRRPESDVRRRFEAAFLRQEQIDREIGWRTDEARELERWRDIVAEVLDDVADPDACFQTLFDAFGRPDAWTCDADAAAVIAAYQASGVVQAVASNFDARLRGLLGEFAPLRGLTPIVISSDVGWRKPAAEFFERLLGALQLPPDEVLFVGDDRDNDYEAARQAGMQAILLDPRKKHLDIARRAERLRDVIAS